MFKVAFNKKCSKIKPAAKEEEKKLFEALLGKGFGSKFFFSVEGGGLDFQVFYLQP